MAETAITLQLFKFSMTRAVKGSMTVMTASASPAVAMRSSSVGQYLSTYSAPMRCMTSWS